MAKFKKKANPKLLFTEKYFQIFKFLKLNFQVQRFYFQKSHLQFARIFTFYIFIEFASAFIL